MSLKLSAVQLGDAASDFGTATIDFVAASNWKTALSQVASVCEMVEWQAEFVTGEHESPCTVRGDHVDDVSTNLARIRRNSICAESADVTSTPLRYSITWA
jgi:hypothetical protein